MKHNAIWQLERHMGSILFGKPAAFIQKARDIATLERNISVWGFQLPWGRREFLWQGSLSSIEKESLGERLVSSQFGMGSGH